MLDLLIKKCYKLLKILYLNYFLLCEVAHTYSSSCFNHGLYSLGEILSYRFCLGNGDGGGGVVVAFPSEGLRRGCKVFLKIKIIVKDNV